MDIREAIEQIKAYDRHHHNVDIRAAIQYLISYGGDEVEQSLLDIMAESSGRAIDPARVASRILAERDPDRDPRYLLHYFPYRKPVAGNSPLRRWMRRIYAYPTHGTHIYGLSRLRRFDPVPAYGTVKRSV